MQLSQLCCATEQHYFLPRDTIVHRLVSTSQVQPHINEWKQIRLTNREDQGVPPHKKIAL